jgi:hypothetical protein
MFSRGDGVARHALLKVEAFGEQNTGEGIGAHEIDQVGGAAQAGGSAMG